MSSFNIHNLLDSTWKKPNYTEKINPQVEHPQKTLGVGVSSSVTLHNSILELDLGGLPLAADNLSQKAVPKLQISTSVSKQQSCIGNELENDDDGDETCQRSPGTPIVASMAPGSSSKVASNILLQKSLAEALLGSEKDYGLQRNGDFIQFTTSDVPEGRSVTCEQKTELQPRVLQPLVTKGLSLSVLQSSSNYAFDSCFQLGDIIGQGGNSTVRHGTEKRGGRNVVCKFIRDSSVWHWHVDPSTNVRIPLEVHLMQQITRIYPDCPYFVRYIEHFDTRGSPRPGAIGGGLANSMTAGEKIYEESLARNPLVQLARKVKPPVPSMHSSKHEMPRHTIIMEPNDPSGAWLDLYDYVEIYGPVSESVTRKIFSHVLASVLMLHQLGVSHNDIKDENVLINRNNLDIKLLDLGSATWLPQSARNPQQIRVPQLATQFYGTKKFASPECVQGLPYRTEVQEVWALGALLFVMLYKADPFKDNREICAVDIQHKIQRHAARGIHISKEAQVALSAMLQKDPRQRIHIHNITKLEWFAGCF